MPVRKEPQRMLMVGYKHGQGGKGNATQVGARIKCWRVEMRRVKYGRQGRQIERCHKHEQMAEKGVGKSEKEREAARE